MQPTQSPSSTPPSFLRRLPMALGAFFRILTDAGYAARLQALDQAPVAVKPAPLATPVKVPAANTPTADLQLLGLFQREARLVDFTQEDLGSYSDADVGAAARVVHEGCRKVLREHFTLAPVRNEAEGSTLRLEQGFDAQAIRLTGNLVGQAPFVGTLSHRGWRATEVRLPTLAPGHDARILAPAEVEL